MKSYHWALLTFTQLPNRLFLKMVCSYNNQLGIMCVSFAYYIVCIVHIYLSATPTYNIYLYNLWPIPLLCGINISPCLNLWRFVYADNMYHVCMTIFTVLIKQDVCYVFVVQGYFCGKMSEWIFAVWLLYISADEGQWSS